MSKIVFIILIIIQLLSLSLNEELINLEIDRSQSHEEKTGTKTPLIVSLSSEDKKEKVKGVDLILIIDDSGSMDSGNKLNLVKDSLKILIELMHDNDNLAIIRFTHYVEVIQDFTKMTEENKKLSINNIKNRFIGSGGTDIYLGLSKALELLKEDYSDGNRIASMILISDGEDNEYNADTRFKNLIENSDKKNYVFTLHTFGYGNGHDSELMNKISKIRDGGYFFIRELQRVLSAFAEIYSSLSTILSVNVQMKIESQFPIEILGIEDMYNYKITKEKPYIFTTELIQFVYGKKYSFITLVDIPKEIEENAEIIKVTIEPFGITKIYNYKKTLSPYAYEEYIRAISFTIFSKCFETRESTIIKEAIVWIRQTYEGIVDWLSQYEDVLNDLNNYYSYGKANLLSKIRELKSQKPGVHYSDENSYQRKIIDESHNYIHKIDVNKFKEKIIETENNIEWEDNNNYAYFYLKEGTGTINGLHFSGEHSTLIVYSESKDSITIKPKSESENLKLYYYFEKKIRLQTIVDFSKGGIFIIKKDFPFSLYTIIDGTKDITFNIQFTNLEYDEGETETKEEVKHLFEIKAYLIDSQQIYNLENKKDYYPNNNPYFGYYDKNLRIGKIVLKKEEIAKKLSISYENYLYIIIEKNENSNLVYKNIEGKFSFVSMDYIYLPIPENYYIFSNLFCGEKNPDLYTLKMEPIKGKKLRLEFSSSGNELECKILKHQNYPVGSEEFYKDNNDFIINRTNSMGKTYIDVTQSNEEENKFDLLIVSIFSTNGGHIAGNEATKLSYTIRYSTYSNYGIYSFNDLNDKNGEIKIEQIVQGKYKITFYPLKSKINEEEYIKENTRFIFKLFPIVKRRQKIHRTISLFEENPIKYIEKNINSEEESFFEIEVENDKNYFFTIFTLSNKNNEIISYNPNKIYKTAFNYEINDINSFENEYSGNQNFEINVNEDITKQYLIVQITDFDEGKYGFIYAKIGDKIYKSIQTLNNYVIISKDNCAGKKVSINIILNDSEENTLYYLTIKLVNEIEINVGENIDFEMLEEYQPSIKFIINNYNEDKNKINIFIKSTNGNENLSVNGYGTNFVKNELFGSLSSNFVPSSTISIEIKAKTGDYISLYSHIINNSKKNVPFLNSKINLYGYLEEKECIYFDQDYLNIKKYQIRILGDKKISIKYNNNEIYDITEPNALYIKEFSQKINKICLKQENDLESIFFNIQIINIDEQTTSKINLEPIVSNAYYYDYLNKNEIRYYRQGTFDSNKNSELKYVYNVRQIKGEIKVYVSKCDTYPNCNFNKDNIEKDENAISLYNINDFFIFSKKSTDYSTYDPEKILVYIVLCLSNSCEFSFILNKSTSQINISKIGKYSTKINKNMIDKFIISKNENVEQISINLYTHSGEVMLRTNDKCEEIKHTIFGNIEKLEIPKSEMDHPFELYVQANMDSVYTIEYTEISDTKYTTIKSNIIHLESIDKEKTIEFSPEKDFYFIKFIPINCDISITYGEDKSLSSQNKIYYYYSDINSEKYYIFKIKTNNDNCMIYTYLEELTNNFYGILSNQVPYYLSLNKKVKNYKLIYPLANINNTPMFRINFFEETKIKITQKIGEEKDDEINTSLTKDFKPSSKLLNHCNNDEICYLMLEIDYEEDIEYPIILEIIPKSLNKNPAILFNNKMKQDFAPIEGSQHYMAKILKDEEGEIYINYKYFNGELNAKLISCDKKSWKNEYDLPEKNEQLIYDNLRQKITFTKKETNKCKNGCYLFVEVNWLESFIENKNREDLNMDYSIYLKKSNDIVQLRLNEFAMGTLSKTIKDNYIEYYSIEIPYSTNKIFIDFSSENAKILIKYGEEKPLPNNCDTKFESNVKDNIYIIEDNNDLKGTIFTLGIYIDKINNYYSQYSIRIRAEHKLYKNYIYSDTNTENICITEKSNESCYFLIPIIHVQKNSNLFLYGISTNHSDNLIISYKKITLEKTFEENLDDESYEKTSKDQFIKNMLIIKNTELNINENKNENILIKIEIPEPGTITLLHTFKSNLGETLLNPKNKILYAMNPNEELLLNIPNGVKSLMHINVINGKGIGGYENDENSMQEISGIYSSIFFQNFENNENKRIKIKTDAENSFYFYAYIKIGSQKRNINDINIGSSNLKTGKGFPIEFFSKIAEDKDYTINFNINNIKETIKDNEKLSNFTIKAYVVTEEIIEKLKFDDTFVYSDEEPFHGKYEVGFDIAKLVLSKDDIKKKYIKDENNYIYLIIEASNNNPSILNKISGDISILQNNNLDYSTPNNIYINGNLESSTNFTNKYKLIKKNEKDEKIRVEFSSSSEDVNYKIYKLSDSTELTFEENKNLGKTNIDINVKNIFEPIIFEIYLDKNDTIEENKKFGYSIRYRTDEGKKIFNDYKTYGETNGNVEIKIEDNKENQNIRSKYTFYTKC